MRFSEEVCARPSKGRVTCAPVSDSKMALELLRSGLLDDSTGQGRGGRCKFHDMLSLCGGRPEPLSYPCYVLLLHVAYSRFRSSWAA